MSSEDKLMISHLLRRAGFGTTPEELARYISLGYENTVEELLNPKNPGNIEIIFFESCRKSSLYFSKPPIIRPF